MTAAGFTRLTALGGKRLAKVIRQEGDGPIEIDDYDQPLEFSARRVTVPDLRSLYHLAAELQDDPRSCIVRGEIAKGADPSRMRRLAHDKPDAPATLEDVPTLIAFFDFDLEMTEEEARRVQLVADPDGAVDFALGLCPAEFRAADLVWSFGASAGIRPRKLSLHFATFLDRPVLGSELKAIVEKWNGDAGRTLFDSSIYGPQSIVYTARPIFEADAIDPLDGCRIGLRNGTGRPLALPRLDAPPRPAPGPAEPVDVEAPEGVALALVAELVARAWQEMLTGKRTRQDIVVGVFAQLRDCAVRPELAHGAARALRRAGNDPDVLKAHGGRRKPLSWFLEALTSIYGTTPRDPRPDVAEAIRAAAAEIAGLPVLIGDAFDEPAPEIAWLVEGLLPTGALALLAAYGGVGKTTLLVQLCASLAAGRDFLGFRVPQAVPTLYLIAEGARHVFLARVKVALARLGLDASALPLWVTPREFAAEIGPKLVGYIERTGARNVVLDTVGLFHDGDENSASDFKAKVVKPLREIMTRRDVSFVLVTHEVKPNPERKGRHRVRGTSALVDDSDVAMRLEAPEGDRATPRLLIFEKVRTGASIEPIPLEFIPSFAIFERVGEDAMRQRQEERTAETDARRLKDLEAQVVRYLKRDPDGLTKAELTAELHPRRVDLVRVLDKLRDESRAFPDRDPKGRAMRWRLSATPRLEVAG